MGWARTALLRAAQSAWLRERAPHYPFVRRNVSRFMPGETPQDALTAVRHLAMKDIGAVLTALGENVTERNEAEHETQHYLELLQEIEKQSLSAELSVKLTHLGLDLDENFCFESLKALISATPPGRTTWIDMEQSGYLIERWKHTAARALPAPMSVSACRPTYGAQKKM